jgi:hypothetical protein
MRRTMRATKSTKRGAAVPHRRHWGFMRDIDERGGRRWGRIARGVLAVAASFAVAACGADETVPAKSNEPVVGFSPDVAAEGPRIWLEAALDGDAARVELWAADLGPVFGYAGHLEWDAGHLGLDGAPSSDDLLAAGDAKTAVHVWTGVAGDLSFGGTRRAPALGEVEIDQPLRVGVVTLRTLAEKQSRLTPSRVIVRRGDGSYVATAAIGGTLVTGGAP